MSLMNAGMRYKMAYKKKTWYSSSQESYYLTNVIGPNKHVSNIYVFLSDVVTFALYFLKDFRSLSA